MDMRRWLGVLLIVSPVLAGPLAPPPGPIAPTNKPLAEVEPRTLISAANTPGDATCVFKITAPGSYYLGANVTGVAGKNGIVIEAANVTLDLNGFAVVGVADSFTGVKLSNASNFPNIAVVNGNVSNWGESGVDLIGNFVTPGSRIENVEASSCRRYGIRCGTTGFVKNCIASNIGPDAISGISSYGIIGFSGSTVEGCVASNCTGYGIVEGFGGVITGCWATNCTLAGISGYGGCVISNCSSTFNGGWGFSGLQEGAGSDGVQIISCVASSNTAGGIEIASRSTVRDCTVTGSGNKSGILVSGTGCRIDSNHVTGYATGIQLTGTTNKVIRNSVTGAASTPYAVGSGNDVGPIGTAATSASPWANLKD